MNGTGRCYMHGGGDGTGAPEGNTNAMTHGLYAQTTNYYKSLDEDEKAFIESLVDSWIENAPFDRENTAKVNRIYKIAIDEHKMWRANDYYASEDFVDVTDIPAENGDSYEVKEENPINQTYDRLSRTSIKELKELGCLDSPDDRQADATESLAKKLSGLSDNED